MHTSPDNITCPLPNSDPSPYTVHNMMATNCNTPYQPHATTPPNLTPLLYDMTVTAHNMASYRLCTTQWDLLAKRCNGNGLRHAMLPACYPIWYDPDSAHDTPAPLPYTPNACGTPYTRMPTNMTPLAVPCDPNSPQDTLTVTLHLKYAIHRNITCTPPNVTPSLTACGMPYRPRTTASHNLIVSDPLAI